LPGTDVPLPGNIQAVFDYTAGQFHKDSAAGPLLHPTRIFVVLWDQGKFPDITGSGVSWGLGPERTIYKIRVPDSYQREICTTSLIVNGQPQVMRALTLGPNSSPGWCLSNDNTFADPNNCIVGDCQPSCVDHDYSACVLTDIFGNNPWLSAKIYRPSLDVRQCTGANATFNGGPAKDPNGKVPLDLKATYKWPGLTYTTQLDPLSGQLLQVIDKASVAPPNVITQDETQRVDTNLWSYCVNSGTDAPAHYAREYRGPQTGALTKTNLCGPEWYTGGIDPNTLQKTGCSSAATNYSFFPNIFNPR
jgi:hypothetical protein